MAASGSTPGRRAAGGAADTRLLFVRHGESEGNRERRLQGSLDLPLTETGLEQARLAAAALARARPVAALYTSPLRRAADTAAAIGRRLALTPVLDDDLRECDVGAATGLTWDEYADRYPEWAARLAEHRGGPPLDDLWPGGETTTQFRARCGRALAKIRAGHAAGTVVVVAHGGTIGWLLTLLLAPGSPHWPAYALPNGSISEVAIEGESARLVQLGSTSHLGR